MRIRAIHRNLRLAGHRAGALALLFLLPAAGPARPGGRTGSLGATSVTDAGRPTTPPAIVPIDSIRMRRMDIYGPEEAARGWIYRAANRLHAATRESVIRRYLLFRAGDPLDPALLEETERNLRALPFIKRARVTARTRRPGHAVVEVETQDTWTTDPIAALERGGGRNAWEVGFRERNFLGSGRSIYFRVRDDPDRISRTLEVRDPHLLGPYFRGEFLRSVNSDGTETRGRVHRPFFSNRTRWSVDLAAEHARLEDRLYEGGAVASRYRDERTEAGIEIARALRGDAEGATRLGAGFRALDEDVDDLETGAVDRRSYRYLYARLSSVQTNYVKMNYVNRDLRYEDFNLGREYSVLLGASPLAGDPAAGATGIFALDISDGRRLGARGFLLGRATLEGRLEAGARNAILRLEGRVVRKISAQLLQTLVAALRYRRGWNLDPEVQFRADGENGLRAYRLYAFSGDRALVLNVEDRLFSGREFFQVVSPGIAIFLDTGTAVDHALRLSDLHTDVGVGLRLGFARAARHNVVRIDFGYALDREAGGRRGWLLSWSSGQAF